jgi:hypothetical protein
MNIVSVLPPLAPQAKTVYGILEVAAVGVPARTPSSDLKVKPAGNSGDAKK